MARPRTSETNAVSDAVRKLRESLHQTQQMFAHTLGMAITTIARWETTRPPRDTFSLTRLAGMAAQNGLHDLEVLFNNEILEEMRYDFCAMRYNLQKEVEIHSRMLSWKLRLDGLESLLANNQLKPKDRISKAVTELSEIRQKIEVILGPTTLAKGIDPNLYTRSDPPERLADAVEESLTAQIRAHKLQKNPKMTPEMALEEARSEFARLYGRNAIWRSADLEETDQVDTKPPRERSSSK